MNTFFFDMALSQRKCLKKKMKLNYYNLKKKNVCFALYIFCTDNSMSHFPFLDQVEFGWRLGKSHRIFIVGRKN